MHSIINFIIIRVFSESIYKVEIVPFTNIANAATKWIFSRNNFVSTGVDSSS